MAIASTRPSSWPPAGFLPALGDFDGDAIPDLIGLPDADAPMTLLYGAGDGTFGNRTTIDPAVRSWKALVADVDRDGWLDVVNVGDGDSAVTLRLGSGTRAAPLGEAARFSTSSIPTDVLLADFDADGRLDLVARVTGALEYWSGENSGHFDHRATLETKGGEGLLGSSSLTGAPLALDWNGDGLLDLVYGPLLNFRPGRGDGTFEAEVPCALLLGLIGDLDRDGRFDLISGTNLLLEMAACHADKIVPLANWQQSGGMALADLDGDANLDVVADAQPNVTIRRGDGRGGFAQPLSLPGPDANLASGSSQFLFGDLNRDSKLDIISARPGGWGVFLNTCK